MNKWPNWLKTAWWALIVIVLTVLVFNRLDNFINGTNTATDIVIFLILTSLYLAPLFKEIELPGIKLKREINEVKSELERIGFQLKMNQEVHSTVSPNIWLNSPPADASLPIIEDKIKAAIKNTLHGYGFTEDTIRNKDITVDDDVKYLFSVRYTMEKELRFLIMPYLSDYENGRHLPIYRLIGLLIQKEILNPQLAEIIKEIYSVCSPAVHGEKVSEKQLTFVKETVPDVIGTLKAISKKMFKYNKDYY